jgi:hypothetical protein
VQAHAAILTLCTIGAARRESAQFIQSSPHLRRHQVVDVELVNGLHLSHECAQLIRRDVRHGVADVYDFQLLQPLQALQHLVGQLLAAKHLQSLEVGEQLDLLCKVTCGRLGVVEMQHSQ